MALAIDGHESHKTYNRCCEGCLTREIGENKRTQYYHRNVTAQLISDGIRFQLDAEPQLPGEDEVATAIRLLERVISNYPRAFDVVLADALYARSNFFNFLIEHHKDVIVVLKANCSELLDDATRFFAGKPPTSIWEDKKDRLNAGTRVVFSQVLRLTSQFVWSNPRKQKHLFAANSMEKLRWKLLRGCG